MESFNVRNLFVFLLAAATTFVGLARETASATNARSYRPDDSSCVVTGGTPSWIGGSVQNVSITASAVVVCTNMTMDDMTPASIETLRFRVYDRGYSSTTRVRAMTSYWRGGVLTMTANVVAEEPESEPASAQTITIQNPFPPAATSARFTVILPPKATGTFGSELTKIIVEQ